MFLGAFPVGAAITFTVNTHHPDTGVATDADGAPSFRVYEDETGTPLLTGSMALLDSSNTDGFYSEQITASTGNGFEVGKCYTVRVAATVDSVTGAAIRQFQIVAPDVAVLDGSNGVETGITVRQALRAILASAAGELSGAATSTVTIENPAGSATRITAAVDEDGNRTSITLNL